jgi:hypothetical protein
LKDYDCVVSQPVPPSSAFTINPQESVVEIVRQYPLLKSSFDAIGMNTEVNKSLCFESLVASCKVQQLPVDEVLDTLQKILITGLQP